MRVQPLPSVDAEALSALIATAQWIASTPEGWRPPQHFPALIERLTAAFGARHEFAIARIHDCILPPPAVAVLAASTEPASQEAVAAFAATLATRCADAFDALRAGRVAYDQAAAFAYLVPVLADGALWGVLTVSGVADARPLDALSVEALRLIAVQLADRLAAGAPAGDRRRGGQERLLQAAIESIEEGIVVYDAEHRVAAYNRAWREQTRTIRPGEDLTGMTLTELYREHIRHGTWTVEQADMILRDILTGRSYGIPDRMMEADGRHIRIRNFQIPGGGIVGLRSDVTDTVERERDLMRAREEAEAASRAKSTFLASVSHELRTPLNAIIGFSDVMVQEVFGPHGVARYKEYIGDIHRSGSLLLSLINDIMDMARIESGKVELSPEPVEIGAIVDDVARLMRLRAEAKQITLVTDQALDLPPVMADHRATTQILLNIVVNAVKFTPNGGHVAIRTRRRGGKVEIAVADTGPGIAGVDLARLGRPFERIQVDAFDATPENKGTGLGLAISRALAELQHGSLKLESELGVGTTVLLRLPFATAEQLRACK
ncbi:MAG: PAS-domain containing protein [Rhodospirillales bacterium]|nr:PAS-domain containing protein [Rhodospirillales bacterium]